MRGVGDRPQNPDSLPWRDPLERLQRNVPLLYLLQRRTILEETQETRPRLHKLLPEAQIH